MELKYRVNEVSEGILSLAEVKEYLRVTEDDQNSTITMCVQSAIGYVESRLGYPIVEREMSLSVTDYDNSEIDLNPEDYHCDCEVRTIKDIQGNELEYFQMDNTLTVIDTQGSNTFTITYDLIPHLPFRRQLYQACMLLTGKFYEQRGDDSRAYTEGGWETINRILDPISRYWL